MGISDFGCSIFNGLFISGVKEGCAVSDLVLSFVMLRYEASIIRADGRHNEQENADRCFVPQHDKWKLKEISYFHLP